VFITDHLRGAVLDQQRVDVMADRTTTVEFIRPAGGRSVTGEMVGLPETGVAGTFVSVMPAEPGDVDPREKYARPRLDFVAAAAGRFRTEKLPPGEYWVVATAYGPSQDRVREVDGGWGMSSGVQPPAYVGWAKITVERESEPLPLRIEMRKPDRADVW
jgi:hypothetical protein